MPSIINATTTNGVAVSGDTSGALALQTNNGTTAVTIDTSQNVSTVKDVTINGVTVGKGAGSGSNNVAVGSGALQANTTASNNTAVGYQAGYSNTTGSLNTFLGFGAGYTSNTTGNTSNTCVGAYAGYNLTTGINNTFIGSGAFGTAAAGSNMTTGSNNTILGGFNGNQNGLDIRTASNYIVLSDGAGNPRGIFDNNGIMTIGTNSWVNMANGGIALFTQIYESQITIGHTTAATAGTTFQTYQYNATTIGNITQTGTTGVAYNTTSDYRLKENVQPMTGALAKVEALNPVTYTWKSDGSDGQGFIAHELQAVVPDAVTGEKDAVDEEGKPVYQAIDTSFLVATLTAAIKEQQAIIESLKTRIEVLENK